MNTNPLPVVTDDGCFAAATGAAKVAATAIAETSSADRARVMRHLYTTTARASPLFGYDRAVRGDETVHRCPLLHAGIWYVVVPSCEATQSPRREPNDGLFLGFGAGA